MTVREHLSDRVIAHLQQLADAPDLSGTRYELGDRVGRGGMGTVWLGRDVELDREVAIKVLSVPDPSPDEMGRMVREARILARLEHPGIVPVHDLGVLPDGRPYYVMKYVRGRRLDEHIATLPSLLERLRLFLQVCDAVAFAHAHGVIHRDLKPPNVMVGPFGEVLVLDWGVAKLRGVRETGVEIQATAADAGSPVRAPGAEVITERGTVLGTRGYMSPEQAAGQVDVVDRPTDIYALGALLRVLLVGSSGGATRPLNAIADRAMGRRPEDRYPTVEELANEIRRATDGDRVDAYQESVLERAVRVTRKYRTPLILVLAYLMVRILLLLV